MKNFIILILLVISAYYIDSSNSREYKKDTRIPVVVIDSGVSLAQSKQHFMCKNGVKSTVKDNGIDNNGHGTNIIGIISKDMDKKYCIISIKVWEQNKDSIVYYERGLLLAISLKPRFVNISMNGTQYSLREYLSIKNGINKGIKFIVAAGNNSTNLDLKCENYPACIKTMLVKEQKDSLIVVSTDDTDSRNYGKVVDKYLHGKDIGFPKMTGTSQATASFTASQVLK